LKFSQVALGTRAEQKTKFLYDGKEQSIVIRPLSQAEEIDVESDAIRAAKAKGAEAVPGNPIYEATRMMAVIEKAILDPDSPAQAREPYFDGGVTQIGEMLDTDTIAHLHALQQAWQEECSPSFRHKTSAELLKIAHTLSEDEHDPLAFARYSLKTQWSLGPFMARLLRGSPVFSSFSGSNSAPSPDSTASAPSPTSDPRDTSNSPTATTTGSEVAP
jgi:hypothetical protein